MPYASYRNPQINTAWVFPGQGVQTCGMGKDLVKLPLAKARFEQAEQILGWSIPEVCQSRDGKLSRTLYIQPCLYVFSCILADLMRERQYQPNLLAGYSLGEYIALYIAGVFDFEVGLELIKKRAQLMEQLPVGMMAVLRGFNYEQLEQQLQQQPNVWRANDDLNQVVISGTPQAVEALLAHVKTNFVFPINVRVAFHSPLMATAVTKFRPILESTPFYRAKVPILSSTQLVPTVEAFCLKENLIRQITEPVRWRAISLRLRAERIKQVVEIGPGKVLTSQMKSICPDFVLKNVRDAASLPLPAKVFQSSRIYL
ncbi:MAG: acyltransferase domain-containing protein [Coleofasciculaceae cyanobacterium]